MSGTLSSSETSVSLAMAEELAGWDAMETNERLCSNEVSGAEVVAAAIARAKRWDPLIHAIAHGNFEGARRSVEAATYKRDRCFVGVPSFVKDLDDQEGLPTAFGTVAMSGYIAKQTTASVQEFLNLGFVSLGKSTTAEFGLTATTEPVHGHATKNPHNSGHSSGGSSGGAASLVAAGVCPIAYASDGGGSIRIPASWCGLVGLKPSRGRLADLASAKRMPVKIATYGVVTRSVRDTARFYYEAERARGQGALLPVGMVEGPSREPLRVGMYTNSPFKEFPPNLEVKKLVGRCARLLEAAGHTVEEIENPFAEDFLEDFFVHWGLMAFGVEIAVRRGKGAELSRLEPWTRGLAKDFVKKIYKTPGSLWRLKRYQRYYQQQFASFDLLLSPTTGAAAPPLGFISPDVDFETKQNRLRSLVPYTPPHNAAGAPAITLPVGVSADGLPLSVQLAAPVGHERRLLEMAYFFEGESPLWAQRLPEMPAEIELAE